MFRLIREVRFALPADGVIVPAASSSHANGHAGNPALKGMGIFLTVQVAIAGEPDLQSGYIVNIKQIDQVVREQALPVLDVFLRRGRTIATASMALVLFEKLRETWPGLARARIGLSPYSSVSVTGTEYPMVRFSQKFEFSAAHRLHNPALTDEQNLALFGKCNNPHGHGHNYEVQITLRGKPDASGQLMAAEKLETIVIPQAIDKLDHKFINIEVEEFAQLNPTVENISKVIYQWLQKPLASAGVDLAAVTVWETPKTWCEYSETAKG